MTFSFPTCNWNELLPNLGRASYSTNFCHYISADKVTAWTNCSIPEIDLFKWLLWIGKFARVLSCWYIWNPCLFSDGLGPSDIRVKPSCRQREAIHRHDLRKKEQIGLLKWNEVNLNLSPWHLGTAHVKWSSLCISMLIEVDMKPNDWNELTLL